MPTTVALRHPPPVLLLAMLAFCVGSDSFALPGLLPLISVEFGLSTAEGGWLVSVYALLIAVAGPLLCTACARWTRRQVLTWAGLLFAAGSVYGGFADSVASLLLCRIATAVGAALCLPTATALAVEMSATAGRESAVARVYVGMTSALVVGVPLVNLVGTHGEWRIAMMLPGLMAMFIVLSMQRRMPTLTPPTAAPLRALHLPLTSPHVLGTLIVTFFGIAGSFAVYTYLASLLAATGSALSGYFAIVLMIFGLAGLGGNLLAARTRNPDAAVAASLGGKALAFLLLAALVADGRGAPEALIVASIVLYGLAGWAFPPLQQSRLAAATPDTIPTTLSLNTSFLYAGMAAGAALGGLAIAQVGLIAACWTGVALEAAALFALWLNCREKRRLLLRTEAP